MAFAGELGHLGCGMLSPHRILRELHFWPLYRQVVFLVRSKTYFLFLAFWAVKLVSSDFQLGHMLHHFNEHLVKILL